MEERLRPEDVKIERERMTGIRVLLSRRKAGEVAAEIVQLLLIESSLTLFYSNLLFPSMLRHLSTFQEAASPPGTLSTVPPAMGEETR